MTNPQTIKCEIPLNCGFWWKCARRFEHRQVKWAIRNHRRSGRHRLRHSDLKENTRLPMCKTIIVLKSSDENKSYYKSFGSELTTQDYSFKGSFLNPISKLGLHLSKEGLIIFPLLDSWSSVFTSWLIAGFLAFQVNTKSREERQWVGYQLYFGRTRLLLLFNWTPWILYYKLYYKQDLHKNEDVNFKWIGKIEK